MLIWPGILSPTQVENMLQTKSLDKSFLLLYIMFNFKTGSTVHFYSTPQANAIQIPRFSTANCQRSLISLYIGTKA